jgi:acyl-CoA oxidase
MTSWADQWRNILKANLRPDTSYQESANALRVIVKSGLLKHTDLRDNPERFFLAHRILAEHAVELGPGHWIRLTVHYNLCMGTVLAVGNPEQVAALDEYQKRGQLGCFGLTERFAGVNSGLVVNATATWRPETKDFVLNSPDDGSCKNWISQGMTADKGLVLASLIVDGKNMGPHAFLIDFITNGKHAPGITVGDMGRKTIGNDLDNAWIRFQNVVVPKSGLLNRYADIDSNGNYVKKQKLHQMEMIGQRLFTGRVAVAQAALTFARNLFRKTQEYSDNKITWGPKGKRPRLSDIPQLKSLYAEANATLARLTTFTEACEAKLADALRKDVIPSKKLVQAIAVAKVQCVENAIGLCHRLKQEVGSYALMATSGFESLDFLSCCKFAEGDSRILMLKMSRDRLRAFGKLLKQGKQGSGSQEDKYCMTLAQAVMADRQKGWDDNWRTVYALADCVMQRVLNEWVGPAKSNL